MPTHTKRREKGRDTREREGKLATYVKVFWNVRKKRKK